MKSSPEQHRTKREVFLTEMDVLIPWEECVRLIKPHWTGGRDGASRCCGCSCCRSGSACRTMPFRTKSATAAP